jgi:hypothetical protein
MRLTIRIAVFLMILAAVATATAQNSKIRQVDFKNFTYAWNDATGEGVPESWHWITPLPKTRITTVSGLHNFEEDRAEDRPSPSPVLSVDHVTFGDLLGDRGEEALVSLNYGTGGTANWDYLYVYQLRNDHPVLLALMETGSRGSAGLVRVAVRAGLLVVDFADKDRMVGDCCSAGYIRVRYRWQKGRFVEVGTAEHGDLDLHRR